MLVLRINQTKVRSLLYQLELRLLFEDEAALDDRMVAMLDKSIVRHTQGARAIQYYGFSGNFQFFGDGANAPTSTPDQRFVPRRNFIRFSRWAFFAALIVDSMPRERQQQALTAATQGHQQIRAVSKPREFGRIASRGPPSDQRRRRKVGRKSRFSRR